HFPYTTLFRSDDSSENSTSWEWDFGDGNTSTDQNPVHTYAAANTYTVCLIASNVNGPGTQACQDVTVTEPVPTPTPVSNFTFTTNDLTASFFDDSSENPTSWEWDFGDGNTSTDQNPVHTYAAANTYTVCLIASNVNGQEIGRAPCREGAQPVRTAREATTANG